MRPHSRPCLVLAALCAACGGGSSVSMDASDTAVFEPGDAGVFEPGDAAWPTSPCGQPVRGYTLDLAPREALMGIETVAGLVHGDGQRVAIAQYNMGTLWVRSFDLADGSANDARVELPDVTEVDWNVWAVASWTASAVALLGAPAPVRRLLWVEADGALLTVGELAVPSELSLNDVVSFVPVSDGFIGLEKTADDSAYVVRVGRNAIVATPIDLPAGASRYQFAGSVDSPFAVVAASRFTETPRVELARLGSSSASAPGEWQTLFEDEPELRFDVTSDRVAVTATRDRDVEVVWFDSSLVETGRQHVTLPYPAVATAVGSDRHALVAAGPDWGLVYAPLDDSGVGSWHTLLNQPFLGPRAWTAGSGYGIVAPSGIVTADAFLLCGEGP